MSCWCSQGSVLGPLLFSIYTSPTAHIAQAHGIQQQQYADDTQLYVALSPNSIVTHVSALESCLESLDVWFCADKSNAILFATSQRSQSLSNQVSVNISGVAIPLSNHVEILCLNIQKPYPNLVSAISVLLNIFVIPLTFEWSVLSLLPLSPLGWSMQILSYTASPQSISLASSVLKILSHVLLQVVVLGRYS